MTFLKGVRKELRFIIAGLCIGVGLGLVFFFEFNGNIRLPLTGNLANQADVSSPSVGQPAPNFELQTINGDRLSPSDLKGKVVLLNFWATWCVPCQQEMPLLQDRASRFPENLVVLGINYDEPSSLVRDFVTGLKITFPILLDPGAKAQILYRVRGYPTTVILDGQGMIRVVHIGELSSAVLDDYLKKLGIGT